jgi:class 3 adenylate cyclase
MSYSEKQDWINGKKRILDILNSPNEIEEKDKVPTEPEFCFDNGYYAWVTAVFVDIRNSTQLFSENKKTTTAKVVKAFMSEIVEILRDDPNRREIGIRGDCVYCIYTTIKKNEDLIIARKAFCINTFMNMFNRLLTEKSINPIKVGVGVATAQELVVKTGRKGSGINSLVWIGKAVSYASKFSNIANKNGNESIIFSTLFYENMISELKKLNKNKNVESWFHTKNDAQLGNYYTCNVVNSNFDQWIKGGMKNE